MLTIFFLTVTLIIIVRASLSWEFVLTAIILAQLVEHVGHVKRRVVALHPSSQAMEVVMVRVGYFICWMGSAITSTNTSSDVTPVEVVGDIMEQFAIETVMEGAPNPS